MTRRIKDRRSSDRGPDLAAMRATVEELRSHIGPWCKEQNRLTELLEQLHDDFTTLDDAE